MWLWPQQFPSLQPPFPEGMEMEWRDRSDLGRVEAVPWCSLNLCAHQNHQRSSSGSRSYSTPKLWHASVWHRRPWSFHWVTKYTLQTTDFRTISFSYKWYALSKSHSKSSQVPLYPQVIISGVKTEQRDIKSTQKEKEREVFPICWMTLPTATATLKDYTSFQPL